jgi:hypothetical protein
MPEYVIGVVIIEILYAIFKYFTNETTDNYKCIIIQQSLVFAVRQYMLSSNSFTGGRSLKYDHMVVG